MMESDSRVTAARLAQAHWRQRPLRDRLAAVHRLRGLIAREGLALARAAGEPRGRPVAETLTAEVIPLAAACEFLEREAVRILQTRRVGGRGRPVWLAGVRSEVHREPHGLVLIVGPANYPLFLPGVQAIQALVAGNAVLLKPGRDGSTVIKHMQGLAVSAGIPESLWQVLPEDVAEVRDALEGGVDLVVFTGSTEAGRAVLKLAAEHVVPVIAELSGEDPFIVRADADLELASLALRFGRELNGGASCIAPQRLCATRETAPALHECTPGVQFAPVASDAEAVQFADSSRYALGATIISRDVPAAERLARVLRAGVVVINDCIMPTADPRLPFGGSGASGFGVTRGPEGLLALTRPKVISVQRGRRRHLEPFHAGDEHFFQAYLQATHGGGWRERLQAWREVCRRAVARNSTS